MPDAKSLLPGRAFRSEHAQLRPEPHSIASHGPDPMDPLQTTRMRNGVLYAAEWPCCHDPLRLSLGSEDPFYTRRTRALDGGVRARNARAVNTRGPRARTHASGAGRAAPARGAVHTRAPRASSFPRVCASPIARAPCSAALLLTSPPTPQRVSYVCPATRRAAMMGHAAPRAHRVCPSDHPRRGRVRDARRAMPVCSCVSSSIRGRAAARPRTPPHTCMTDMRPVAPPSPTSRTQPPPTLHLHRSLPRPAARPSTHA